ncbi:MAG: rod shape-determining protein RodA [Paludibacteraceae bacterium]|nr:rod shape-determining protein RodA [Paludibacteraceae bacterium]
MRREQSITKTVDKMTVAIYVILVLMGCLAVYCASYDFDNHTLLSGLVDWNQRACKQLVWAGVGGFLAVMVLLVNARIFDVFAYLFYGAILALLIVTIFIAPDIKGSHSWLVLGPVSFQPAELAKAATALAVAKCMSQYEFRLEGIISYVRVCILFMLPMVLIILQNETGSALVYMSFFLVLYRKGMPGVLLYLAVVAVTLFVLTFKFANVYIQDGETGNLGLLLSQMAIVASMFGFLIVMYKNMEMVGLCAKVLLGTVVVARLVNFFITVDYTWFGYAYILFFAVYAIIMSIRKLKKSFLLLALFAAGSVVFCLSGDYLFDNVLQPHQQSRINVLLGVEDDPTGAGYNVNQSKIAIGSGGFFGKGFLKGTQTKLDYVPEQTTDFIFCTVGEEFGFLGCMTVIGLFLLLMWRLVVIAERQTESFNQVYCYSVVSIIFFHFMINIGMVIGIMPVIGIPLPFFSYGGSSLWGFTLLLFILLRLDASRLER